MEEEGPSADFPAGFEIGSTYTRDRIHAAFGGSKRACLPTRDGTVVAACLLKTFNPDAPRVVLCGTGVRNGPAGASLAAQTGAIPFFTRVATGLWRYEGRFVVVDSLVSGPTFDRLVAHSARTRESVSRVVRLVPASECIARPRVELSD